MNKSPPKSPSLSETDTNNNKQLETISGKIENQLEDVLEQIEDTTNAPETVETEAQKTTTITLTLNETTISNVPDDKKEILQESADVIYEIAFNEDSTLSVLRTNYKNPSQQIALLDAFGILHEGLTEKNLNWFKYENGGITVLILSETDGAKATEILKQHPNLEILYLSGLKNPKDLDPSKIEGLKVLSLDGLTENQVPWQKIHTNVTKAWIEERWAHWSENPS